MAHRYYILLSVVVLIALGAFFYSGHYKVHNMVYVNAPTRKQAAPQKADKELESRGEVETNAAIGYDDALRILHVDRSEYALRKLWNSLKRNTKNKEYESILRELLSLAPVELALELVAEYPNIPEAVKPQYLRSLGAILHELTFNISENGETDMIPTKVAVENFMLTVAFNNDSFSDPAYTALIFARLDGAVQAALFKQYVDIYTNGSLPLIYGQLSETEMERAWARNLVMLVENTGESQEEFLSRLITIAQQLRAPARTEIAQSLIDGLDLNMELLSKGSEEVTWSEESLGLMKEYREVLMRMQAE